MLTLEYHQEHISSLLTNPGVQEWRENNALIFTPEFSQFVELCLSGGHLI
jgi:hypothetical protein